MFIAGKVTRDTGDPLSGAAVVVEELSARRGREKTRMPESRNVPPGSYHVSVRAEGTARTEVAATPQARRSTWWSPSICTLPRWCR